MVCERVLGLDLLEEVEKFLIKVVGSVVRELQISSLLSNLQMALYTEAQTKASITIGTSRSPGRLESDKTKIS